MSNLDGLIRLLEAPEPTAAELREAEHYFERLQNALYGKNLMDAINRLTGQKGERRDEAPENGSYHTLRTQTGVLLHAMKTFTENREEIVRTLTLDPTNDLMRDMEETVMRLGTMSLNFMAYTKGSGPEQKDTGLAYLLLNAVNEWSVRTRQYENTPP